MFKYNYLCRFLIFTCGLIFSAQANICAEVFAEKSISDPQLSVFDPQLFAKQMSQGLLLREGQDGLFKFYITHYFLKAGTIRQRDISLEKVLNTLKDYPDLDFSKLPLREQNIHFVDQHTSSSDNFKNSISSFKKTSNQIRNNLFQIEANYGFWTKLLDFSFEELDSNLSKKEQKEKYKESFINYLNTTTLNKEVRNFIKDPSQDYQEKTIVLYKALDKIKESKPKNHKISQVMVELVHTAGFGNKFLIEGFKNQDTTKIIETVEKILQQRDFIALKLGFNNFLELKNSLNSNKLDTQKILQLENIVQSSDIDSSKEIKTLEGKTFRLRMLSIQESPYRSCLSGDCATSGYFERALDPNYIYFTLTDSKHRSSGHVTLVLGMAKDGDNVDSTKVAFVDKIQDIPLNQLEAVLEGISLSLKEQGYKLGLPMNVGNHNGLSNDEHLRQYVEEHLLHRLNNQLNKFTPHQHNNNIKDTDPEDNKSRANQKLNLREWTDIKLENAQISPGEFPINNIADKNLTTKHIANYILSLKNSKKEEDQISFFKLILKDNLKDTLDYIYFVLGNQEVSFNIRKQAFFSLIYINTFYKNWLQKSKYVTETFNLSFLEKYMSFFSDSESKLIKGEMSNWSETFDDRRDFMVELSSSSFDNIPDKLSPIFKKLFTNKNFFIHIIHNKNTSISFIKKFLENKIDSKLDFSTVLTLATRAGNLNVVKFLIESGADVNVSSVLEDTALMNAAEHNHLSIVKLLVKSGANIDAGDMFKNTALMLAAKHNHLDIVKFLVESGADINAKDAVKNTALIVASKNNQLDIVKFLVESGADINARDTVKDTALNLATQHNHLGIVKFLVESGAR